MHKWTNYSCGNQQDRARRCCCCCSLEDGQETHCRTQSASAKRKNSFLPRRVFFSWRLQNLPQGERWRSKRSGCAPSPRELDGERSERPLGPKRVARLRPTPPSSFITSRRTKPRTTKSTTKQETSTTVGVPKRRSIVTRKGDVIANDNPDVIPAP